MNVTPIEWTDFSANPLKFRTPDGRVVWACEKISDGCKNCYAEDLSHRYGGSRRAGDWNASTMKTLTPFLDNAEIHKMLTAKRIGGKDVAGSRCFVGDMTDIFGEWVSDELLDRLFAVFYQRNDVTWQVLTKRADRLPRYFRRYSTAWPMPNVHLGVSVENRKQRDRIIHLNETPAAVRFLSLEPLLEDLELNAAWIFYIDWLIAGGESGSGARPCDVAWLRNIVRLGKGTGKPVFVKQLGQNAVCRNDERDEPWPGCTVPIDDDYEPRYQGETAPLVFRNRKGGDPTEWADDLRVRQFPRIPAASSTSLLATAPGKATTGRRP